MYSSNIYIKQALFVVSMLTAKPVFVVSVLFTKAVFVVSVGLRVFQKNLMFTDFLSIQKKKLYGFTSIEYFS